MAAAPPRGTRRTAAVAFILVTAMLDIVAMGIVIPVLPALVEEFAGSGARAGAINGVLVALWALMQFVCAPAIGSLSDRYGRRPVVLLSAAGLGADYALMAVAPDLWWLAAGRMVAGITSASFSTVYAYMADITPPERRSRAFGLVGAAFSAGFVLGPLLGGVLGGVSPRAPFWVAAAMSGAAFLYGLLVLPESLPPGRRTAFSWRKANPFGAFALLRSKRELLALAAVTFLVDFAHHVFSAVFVLYAAHRFGWGAWDVGLLLAFVGALDMVVQGVLVGPVVRRLGDRRVMTTGLLGGAAGLLCIGLAPNGLLLTLAVVPNALWGLSMPTLQSLMTRLVSPSEQGRLQGATASVGSVAGVLSPVFFGAVYAMSVGEAPLLPHPGAAFVIASLTLLGAAAIARSDARRAGPVPAEAARPGPPP